MSAKKDKQAPPAPVATGADHQALADKILDEVSDELHAKRIDVGWHGAGVYLEAEIEDALKKRILDALAQASGNGAAGAE